VELERRQLAQQLEPTADVLAREGDQPLDAEVFYGEAGDHAAVGHGPADAGPGGVAGFADVAHEAAGEGVAGTGRVAHVFERIGSTDEDALLRNSQRTVLALLDQDDARALVEDLPRG